jgi:Zinc-binding dehydrogenase
VATPATCPPEVLQSFPGTVAAGTTPVPLGQVYRFTEIAEAHAALESSQAAGKLAVLT